MAQSMNGSLYATPFVINKDTTNKYKINPKVEGTHEPEQTGNMIPFLRDS